MRSLAEWLVVPLLLLPIVAGAGLVLWAEKAWHRARTPYVLHGPETARAWLREGGSAGWMPRRMAALATSLPSDLVSCTHPTASARLRVTCDALGTGPWSFAADLPSPIAPAMLAQPGVRLALETGSAPIDVDGTAEGALALRALLTTPDLDALRLAPLPPATKRYVLRRWRLGGLGSPAREQADALLAAFARYVDAVEQRGAPLPLGAHRLGDLEVLSFAAEVPALVVVGPVVDPRLRHVLLEVGDEESPARLTWRFPPLETTADTVLWQGRLETPLAGTFTFHARWRGWWDTPWVRRWAGPALAVLLAALLLPLALLVSLRRRRRLDEARVRFLNELAHDLRTPLASLRLHADLLSEGRAKPEKREGYLHLLSREAARLSSLLANLLDLSRLEHGRRHLEAGTVDVGNLAYRAARDFVLLHPDRETDLTVEGPERTWVRADLTVLARCLANLLENAGKFTAPGTPIRVGWAAEGGEVVVRVADEGPGIPISERRRVFQRYARGARARADAVPGTGLGLALVRELVAGMGGTVAVVESDVGAIFEIRLKGAKP